METGIENADSQQAIEDKQPVEDVKDSTEEAEASSQAEGNSDLELYVDEDDGDQKKPNMSQEQAYAAFRKEQGKRKEKQKIIDAEKERAEKLQRELDDLKGVVGKLTKGEPPTMEDCGFDEVEFQSKTREYYSSKSDDVEIKPDKGSSQTANDEAQFYLYQKEQDIMSVMPSYSESKERVREHLEASGIGNTEQAFEYLSEIARQKGVDIARSIVAIDKNPSIINDLIKAGNSQIITADIIERASSKVKTRSKKSIDSQPEPNLNNKGPIDHSSAQVQKLREAWVANSNKSTYAAYKAAKDKLNAKVNRNG